MKKYLLIRNYLIIYFVALKLLIRNYFLLDGNFWYNKFEIITGIIIYCNGEKISNK